MQRTTATKTLLTSALGMILTGSLVGDVTTAYYTSGSNYGYQLIQMPDFDQRRNGLAASSSGTPGGMYCVPTACTNLLGYMSSHGEPGLGPDFADWENEVDYADVTDFIDDLGDDMLTTGTGGTAGLPAFATMFNRVVFPTGFRYMVGYEFRNSFNVVTLREMTRSGIFDDAIQTVCYGRYDTIGSLWGSTVIDRTGGHCMTFTGSERSGTYRHMWANDPADSSVLSTQSTFGADDWDTPWVGNLRVASSIAGAVLSPVQGMNRVMRGSTSQFRLIDSRIVIRPVGCTSWGEWEGNSSAIWTDHWSLTEGRLVRDLVTTLPFDPEDVIRLPLGDLLPIERTQDGFARLWRQSDDQGTFRPIEMTFEEGPRMLDFAISKNLGILALGSDGNLYELPSDPEMIINPDSMRPVLEGLQGFDRIATDEQTGLSCLMDIEDGTIILADRYFEHSDRYDIRLIDLVSETIRPVFADFDRDGKIELLLCGRDGQGQQTVHLTRFEDDRAIFQNITGQLRDGCQGDCEIRGLALEDSGALVVNQGGRIRSFNYDRKTGLFIDQIVGGTMCIFAGLDAGRGLQLDRSFTNHDPRLHNTEGWRLQIDESEACPNDNCGIAGDLNGDNQVDGQDLGTLLAAWDSDSEIADLDGDGRVGGPDLAILLGAYGS